MATREFTAVFQKKGRWVAAWVEEVPGVNTQGRTMKEAKENLRDALLLMLKENKKLVPARSKGTRKETFQIAIPV